MLRDSSMVDCETEPVPGSDTSFAGPDPVARYLNSIDALVLGASTKASNETSIQLTPQEEASLIQIITQATEDKHLFSFCPIIEHASVRRLEQQLAANVLPRLEPHGTSMVDDANKKCLGCADEFLDPSAGGSYPSPSMEETLRLLHFFAFGTVHQFKKSHSELGAKLLNSQQQQKLSLVSLMSLASKSTYLPYSRIAEQCLWNEYTTLSSVERTRLVEALVTEAIHLEVLEGRMDNLTEVLHITNVLGRGMPYCVEEIERLYTGMVEWRNKIKDVEADLRASKADTTKKSQKPSRRVEQEHTEVGANWINK